jgi:hypothetical protein
MCPAWPNVLHLHLLCLQVEALRGEVARYQSRLAELENDFLSLDVVASTEVGAAAARA